MKKVNGFWFFTLSLLGLFVLVSIVRLPALGVFFAMNKDNSLGDAFNGLTAPFIGLISAYLLYLALMAQNETNKMQAEASKLQLIQYETSVLMQMFERIDNSIESFKYYTVKQGGDVQVTAHGIQGMREVIKGVNKAAQAAGGRKLVHLSGFPQLKSMAFIFNRIINLAKKVEEANIPDDIKKDFMLHLESYGKNLAVLASSLEYVYIGDRNDKLFLEFQSFWTRFKDHVYG